MCSSLYDPMKYQERSSASNKGGRPDGYGIFVCSDDGTATRTSVNSITNGQRGTNKIFDRPEWIYVAIDVVIECWNRLTQIRNNPSRLRVYDTVRESGLI